jgi:ApaG protein
MIPSSQSVQVSVRVLHSPAHSNADHQFYIYFVTFTNTGSGPVQLRSRHFVIRDGNGGIHEVDGEGVVGEQPVIAPGERYDYHSGVPIGQPPGSMGGHYTFEDSAGQLFEVPLPEFALPIPDGYSSQSGQPRILN